PSQHSPARAERRAAVARAPEVGSPRLVVGGGDLRASSGDGGIRRLDYRTQERAFVPVLSARRSCVFSLPSEMGLEALRGNARVVSGRVAEQDGDVFIAGGAPTLGVVEDRPDPTTGCRGDDPAIFAGC